MNIEEVLQQIIAERDKLNIAIAALQSVVAPKRRGRPPKNPLAAAAAFVTPAASAPSTTRRRPRRSKAQREAQAARMRKYWAERKKNQGEGAKARKRAKKAAKQPVPKAE